jgi:hypothetical protein
MKWEFLFFSGEFANRIIHSEVDRDSDDQFASIIFRSLGVNRLT